MLKLFIWTLRNYLQAFEMLSINILHTLLGNIIWLDPRLKNQSFKTRLCGTAILRGSRKRKACLRKEVKAAGTLKPALIPSKESWVNEKSSNTVAREGGLLNQSHIYSTEVINYWNLFLDVRLSVIYRRYQRPFEVKSKSVIILLIMKHQNPRCLNSCSHFCSPCASN